MLMVGFAILLIVFAWLVVLRGLKSRSGSLVCVGVVLLAVGVCLGATS